MTKWLYIVMVYLSFGVLYANTDQMKITLVKIINQLQAIKPLINQAKTQQDVHPREKINFDVWQDNAGKTHNGLRQDIEAIQHSLIMSINQKNTEPRIYKPIKGDFTRHSNV